MSGIENLNNQEKREAFGLTYDEFCEVMKDSRRSETFADPALERFISGYQKPVITEKTIESIKNHPQMYTDSPVRVQMGKIYIDEEFKKRSNDILESELPGEEKMPLARRKKEKDYPQDFEKDGKRYRIVKVFGQKAKDRLESNLETEEKETPMVKVKRRIIGTNKNKI